MALPESRPYPQRSTRALDCGRIVTLQVENQHWFELRNGGEWIQLPAAFDIMKELMYRSIPLLQEYQEEHGKELDITDEQSIRDLAEYSIRVAVKLRFSRESTEATSGSQGTFDVATDLLLACLNLYSEHVMNYDLVEEQSHILTFYILAFPTFTDENLKVLILKTIEFVVAGVSGSNAVKPIEVLSEVFMAICKPLLHGKLDDSLNDEQQKAMMDGLFEDTVLINESLEKLFQFDNRVHPSIVNNITNVVETVSSLILKELADRKQPWEKTFEVDGVVITEPASQTPLCRVTAATARVVALVMGIRAKQPVPLLIDCNAF